MVKLGINIHPVLPVAPKNPKDPWTDTRQPSAQEKIDLDRFLVESNADANLVMNDIDNARRIAALVPQSKTIFRLYNKNVEGALWKPHTPASYVEGMKGYFDERLILNIGNEPDGKMPLDELKRAIDFYCGVMVLLGREGQQATLPAWGSGNPKTEWFTDDESWRVIEPLFQAFKEYPTNTLNLHSYFNKHGLGYGSGHIGRHEIIAEWVMKRLGFVPDMYFTEYGADNVAGNPGPWMEVFGENDIGETRYAEILTLGPVKAFHQSYVKGVMVYCWWAYADWRLYDISKAKIVQKSIIRFNAGVIALPPPPPPAPTEPTLPTDLGNPIRVRVEGDNWLLRAEPTIKSAQIGRLIIGEEIRLYAGTATLADGESWKVIERVIPVISEARRGWTAMPTPVYVPPPPPLPVETLELIAQIAVVRAKIHAMASMMEDAVNALKQLEDNLATKKAA